VALLLGSPSVFLGTPLPSALPAGGHAVAPSGVIAPSAEGRFLKAAVPPGVVAPYSAPVAAAGHSGCVTAPPAAPVSAGHDSSVFLPPSFSSGGGVLGAPLPHGAMAPPSLMPAGATVPAGSLAAASAAATAAGVGVSGEFFLAGLPVVQTSLKKGNWDWY